MTDKQGGAQISADLRGAYADSLKVPEYADVRMPPSKLRELIERVSRVERELEQTLDEESELTAELFALLLQLGLVAEGEELTYAKMLLLSSMGRQKVQTSLLDLAATRTKLEQAEAAVLTRILRFEDELGWQQGESRNKLIVDIWAAAQEEFSRARASEPSMKGGADGRRAEGAE